MGSNSDLARAFFAAAAAGEGETLRAICAPGIQWRHNGGPAIDLDALIATAAAMRSVMPDFRYENPVRSDTADGFVEEHRATGTLPDGKAFSAASCMVGRVENGKIIALNEYFDTAAAAELFRAMNG